MSDNLVLEAGQFRNLDPFKGKKKNKKLVLNINGDMNSVTFFGKVGKLISDVNGKLENYSTFIEACLEAGFFTKQDFINFMATISVRTPAVEQAYIMQEYFYKDYYSIVVKITDRIILDKKFTTDDLVAIVKELDIPKDGKAIVKGSCFYTVEDLVCNIVRDITRQKYITTGDIPAAEVESIINKKSGKQDLVIGKFYEIVEKHKNIVRDYNTTLSFRNEYSEADIKVILSNCAYIDCKNKEGDL